MLPRWHCPKEPGAARRRRRQRGHVSKAEKQGRDQTASPPPRGEACCRLSAKESFERDASGTRRCVSGPGGLDPPRLAWLTPARITFGRARSARGPRLGNEDDAKPVGVAERDAACLPVRVCRLDRLSVGALACLADRVGAAEVEDEQAIGVWDGCALLAAGRELELRLGPRQRQENPVVTVVVLEVSELA